MTRTHVRARGHRLHGVLAGHVLDDLALDLAQRLALGLLGGERRAELRLAAGTAQEEHEVARDRERRLPVEVPLDERQREVHAGGHAGRRPDIAVADEDRLGVDLDAGVQARKGGRGRPVGRGAAAVQEPGLSENEGAGAHRGGAAGAGGGARDPADEGRVVGGLARARAAGDDQRVELRSRPAEDRVGHERKSARGLNRSVGGCIHADLVGGLAASRRGD